jgi:sugar/nucleoside kinase (ribokinase family)
MMRSMIRGHCPGPSTRAAGWLSVLGARRGAIAVDANGLEHAVDAVPVGTMIDSNGAGDAFTAGLIHGLVDRGWRLDRALRAAAIAGATAVMSRSLASDRLTAGLLETA